METRRKNLHYLTRQRWQYILVLISSILLSLLTVWIHVRTLRPSYISDEGNQIKRHYAVLQGKTCDPWQYRVLADYLLEGNIYLFKKFSIPHSVEAAFISFRCIQGIMIFLTYYLYYKKLGLSTAHSLMGMSILAWGMTHANYDSDLQFNTYFDILFYLLAGLVILHDKPLWIIVITAFAALNRETSGLIPLMLIASILPIGSGKLLFLEVVKTRLKIIIIVAISLTLYAMVFSALRLYYGTRPLFIPWGHYPGFDLLKYNLLRPVTWVQLFATFGIIPILAILSFKNWPYQLKVNFWVIIPIWFLIHIFYSVMAETRLFLVPQTLVFIPGALFLLKYNNSTINNGQCVNGRDMSSKIDQGG